MTHVYTMKFVEGATGKPIAGIELTVMGKFGIVNGTTDVNGTVSVEMPDLWMPAHSWQAHLHGIIIAHQTGEPPSEYVLGR